MKGKQITAIMIIMITQLINVRKKSLAFCTKFTCCRGKQITVIMTVIFII